MSTNRKAQCKKTVEQSVDQVETIADSYTPPSQKKNISKSQVWDHFEKNKGSGGEEFGKCLYCGKQMPFVSVQGTSNLWKHYRKCFKVPANCDKNQKLITSSVVDKDGKLQSGLGNWNFDQDYARHMLARFVMANEQPFLLVENKEFREFVTALQPRFTHISRFTIARDCYKLYVSYKEELKKALGSLRSRVALTTDVWSSMQKLNYLCLTVHFIDEDWRLHKRVLSFVVMPSHKGKEIGKTVERCINEWGIETKISTLTVDNASSNDVAVGYLRERLNANKSLLLGGEFFHMRCAAHILNLIVRDGLKESDIAIDRIRNAVKYVRSSSGRAQLFQKCIEDEKLPHKGSVCLDIATRWNSTYLMLDTALKFKKAFDRLEDEDSSFASELLYETPNSVDWEIAGIMAAFLEDFYETTKRMSGSLYVTANKYFQEVISILTSLTAWASDPDPKIQSMAMNMREKFDKYYGRIDKTNLMVLLSVVLDPSCKLSFFRFCFKKIYGDDEWEIKELVDSVKIVVQRLFEEYEKEFEKESANISSSTQVSSGPILREQSQHKSKKVKFCNEFRQFQDDDEAENEEKSELERYLSERAEPYDIDFDVLGWWRENQSKYKILAKMAKDILAIPVSTVASESTFSTSGRVLDQFRSSLSPKVVEALVCGRDWVRSDMTPINVEQILLEAEKYEAELGATSQEVIDSAES